MRSSHRSVKAARSGRARLTMISAVAAFSLILGQAFVALAGTASDPRSRDAGATSDTTIVSDSGKASASTKSGSTSISTRTSHGGGAQLQLPKIAIVSNQIAGFQGLLAGGDPNNENDWTPGNLCAGSGPCYHELDNVPHRILLNGLTSGTTYEFTILADTQKSGTPGYDNINTPTAISGVTGGSGGITLTQNPDTTIGCGVSTTCISYTFSFVASGTTAEIRFNVHLAIGSHLFNGSSLSARVLGAARNVPLPVKDILLDIRAHKFNDLNANGTQDQGEPDLSGWTMTLYSGTTCFGSPVDVSGNIGTDPNPGVTDASGNVDWTNLSASDGDTNGDFSVQETQQAGWNNTTPLCQVVGISGNQNLANFGNQENIATLVVIKHVINDNGGTALAGAFTMNVTATNPSDASFPGAENGTTITLDAGIFNVTETGPSGYSASFSGCSGSVLAGGSATCTITNNDVAPPPPPPPPPSPGSIVIVKGGPSVAHVGDSITYTFDVSLGANSTAVHSVTVSDPICDTGTLSGPTGDDGDAVLEQGETWHFTCTHVVTASDPDPLPNTATANGTDANGNHVSDTDSHVVDIIHPGIRIVKTANPTHGEPGATITYTFKVTNTGDVDLFNVTVKDDKIGQICDIPVLHVGETVTCTATFVIPEDANVFVENVAVAAGKDETGKKVSDDDNAEVNVVLGKTITPTPPGGPGGVAFTGSSGIVPLGGLALLLLLVGSGMLWMSRRRDEHAAGYKD